MKNFLTSIHIFCAVIILSAQQNIVILPGTNITTANNAVIVFANCNLDNASNNANFSNSLLTESGNINCTIGGTGILNFKQITINKPASTLRMNSNLLIQDRLIFQSGHVDLNNHILELAPLALLVGEKSSSRLIGDNGGYAAIEVIMNEPNLQNPGNLGLSVTSLADMGSVSILRGHKIQTNNGSPFSIKRHYAIESTEGNNFIGTLRFAYFDEELGNISEPLMQIWSSADAMNWENKSYTNKNEVMNFIESSGLTQLEWFTMSNPVPGIIIDTDTDARINAKKETNKMFNIEARLYPNPVNQKEQVWVELDVDRESKGAIQIVSNVGQIINTQTFQANIGKQKVALKTNDLLDGLYLVHIVFDEGTRRILKLHIL